MEKEKRCRKHDWRIVSHFKAMNVVVVRRKCTFCDKTQDIDIQADCKGRWYKAPEYQLSKK